MILTSWCESATKLVLGGCCFRDIPEYMEVVVSKLTYAFQVTGYLQFFALQRIQFFINGTSRTIERRPNRWTGEMVQTITDDGDYIGERGRFSWGGVILNQTNDPPSLYSATFISAVDGQPALTGINQFLEKYAQPDIIPTSEFESLPLNHPDTANGFVVQGWRVTESGLVLESHTVLPPRNNYASLLKAEYSIGYPGGLSLLTTDAEQNTWVRFSGSVTSRMEKFAVKHASRACLVRGGACEFRYSDRTALENGSGLIVSCATDPIAEGLDEETTERTRILFFQDQWNFRQATQGLPPACCTTVGAP